MNWQTIVKNNLGRSLKERRVGKRPNNLSVQLKLNQFQPVSGWYKSDIPVTFKITNNGNWPSFNAVVAIYAGRTGKNISEFGFVSSAMTSIFPGQTVTTQFIIKNNKLPSSGPFMPLPGGSKAILIAVCFDPFLCPANLDDIDESAIIDCENLDGGYYANALINRYTGEVVFGYEYIR